MAVLKVKLPDGTFADIAGTGTAGRDGGPVPVGGNPGEVIQKTGAGDFEVGWVVHPRVAAYALVGTINTHATTNTMGNLVTTPITINPDRTYHIMASWRAIQDPGALLGLAQAKVVVNGAQMEGYDCISGPDSGLWGAWSNFWYKTSAELGVASGAAAEAGNVTLDIQLNAASKTVYAPRIMVVEY